MKLDLLLAGNSPESDQRPKAAAKESGMPGTSNPMEVRVQRRDDVMRA